jgi:hypothetical protein
LFSGAFSLAWFSAVAPATFTRGAPLLFMLPFWVAGAVVAKTAVLDPCVSSQLTIGRRVRLELEPKLQGTHRPSLTRSAPVRGRSYAWSLRSTAYRGVVLKEREGPTDDLRGAQAEVTAYINGAPQCELRLYGESGTSSLGLALSADELEYLEAEINGHLSALRVGAELPGERGGG